MQPANLSPVFQVQHPSMIKERGQDSASPRGQYWTVADTAANRLTSDSLQGRDLMPQQSCPLGALCQLAGCRSVRNRPNRTILWCQIPGRSAPVRGQIADKRS
jgi:hypothetical protein